MTRLTKIVATLGPSSSSPEVIGELIAAGMDVARLNFSHGDDDSHRRNAEAVRAAAAASERAVAILQDIQGPKIRVGRFPGKVASFELDETVIIRQGAGTAPAGEIMINYDYLLEDVEAGHGIALADGLVRLMCESVDGSTITARVLSSGEVRDRQGVALPDTDLRLPVITDKDREDLELGRELDVDYVAVSFVRSAAHLKEVQELAGDDVRLIAKIELAAAYANLDEILTASSGAMVARGDLGVELPLEQIPRVQRDILDRTNRSGRISITATEMLESMVTSPRPTRAEVTDVANAVREGTDAVMLSGETAIGRHPVRAVEYMDRICREVEAQAPRSELDLLPGEASFASAVARAAVEASEDLGIKTIVAFTERGRSALLVSKYRPTARIFAFTPVESTRRRMALLRGVTPEYQERRDHTDHMIAAAEKHLERSGICETGDGVVMVAGIPPNHQASTNLVKLHVIGERMETSRRPRT